MEQHRRVLLMILASRQTSSLDVVYVLPASSPLLLSAVYAAVNHRRPYCSARAKHTLLSAKSARTLLCESTSRFSNWQSHDKVMCFEIES